jgi:oxygen-independent coproporphyrinogen III oxidase
MIDTTHETTGLGNYFVANYPPFSAWRPEHLPAAHTALESAPRPNTPLGLYLHIPFCRKRCKFCYFRVYTDKNARDVETYLDALVREVQLYRALPVVGGRDLHFVYFGGGTPSYLSATQLKGLFEQLQALFPWRQAAEVTFECEPGTLQQHKLETLKEYGVTRLSLGIENFSDRILESNGRAHLSAEIFRAYGWARDLGFNQINIDLIAGMVGETWDNWRDCVQKTIELAPECVTIYQMELPYNTVFSKELKIVGQHTVDPDEIADWPTKRAWVDYAFAEMAKAGYSVSSAYTMVRDPQKTKFVYRDSLWRGAAMSAACMCRTSIAGNGTSSCCNRVRFRSGARCRWPTVNCCAASSCCSSRPAGSMPVTSSTSSGQIFCTLSPTASTGCSGMAT